MSEHCNCGTSAVFCAPNHAAPVVAHNGRVNDLVQRSTSCDCGSSALSPRRVHRQLRNLHGQRDHGDQLCVATGKMTTCGTRTTCTTGTSITLKTYWGISSVRRTVWTMGKDLCVTTGIDEERENVLLVHTGHDAEHHGPANQGRDTSRGVKYQQSQPFSCHCRRRAQSRSKHSGPYQP